VIRRLIRNLAVGAGVVKGLVERPDRDRIVPPGEPNPGAELAVAALLLLAFLFAVAFIVVYATDSIPDQTQFLGIALGGALLSLAGALGVVSKRLVVNEDLEEEYPEIDHEEDQEQVVALVEDSGSHFTRKRLLKAMGALAGGTLGLAFLTPVLSLGPFLDVSPLWRSRWGRGRRLVDEDGHPYRADEIETETFYTAYPEGLTEDEKDEVGAPVVVVRLEQSALRLPPERRGWAPQGILAFSKVCTHAACAISLYRKPTFPDAQPRPALVCPCHYSTFDPARGGKVIFGPAGRPLPQLPLVVDRSGHLRAAGPFSSPPGPSWWGVRLRRRST